MASMPRSKPHFGFGPSSIKPISSRRSAASLQRSGRLEGPFEDLFSRFWRRYLEGSGDGELCTVIGPFFAFRGLVIANPLWYPTLSGDIRTKLLNFVRAVLDNTRFDPSRVNDYCQSGRVS